MTDLPYTRFDYSSIESAMGIFSVLFGGKKKSSAGLSSEVSQIFERIAKFTTDEDLQNSMHDPMIKDQIVGGLDVDQLPHAIGEFGRSGENPIPVNGVLGELLYLSLLKTENENRQLLFHRLGSVDTLDVYETVSIDGSKWDILFFSLYHPRKSRIAPTGYTISEPRSQIFLYGTNRRVDDFPHGLHQAIRQTTKDFLGIPLPPPQVREAEEKVQFRRPREHEERVRTAIAGVTAFRG